MADTIEFIVDPGDRFKNAMTKAIASVDDLTIPLQLIARQWFKSNRALFLLKSQGKFADLSDAYKEQKEKLVGFVYPILKRSGALEQSVTDPQDSDAISVIVNKTGLILGTKKRYALYLHFGTKKMPARPFVMIGAEQTGPEEFNLRESAWVATIEDYVMKRVKKDLETTKNG